MLYTYQQVLHLIENNEAYKQKEPTERGRKKERQKRIERKTERKKERILRQDSDKVVIKYMYITQNTTFTSTCYILTNKCCT